MKTCSKCNLNKELTTFRKSPSGKDGIHAWCRKCEAKLTQAYKKTHLKESAEHQKLYRKRHPGRVNANNAKRRAAKLNRTPDWLTESQCFQIEQFYIEAHELQWLNDPLDPLTVDHIIPLQGENVSGLHVPWNLQIIPNSLNCSKRNFV